MTPALMMSPSSASLHRRGAGGAVWTPEDIPDLAYWWDGETGITLGTPPNVAGWHPRVHTVDASMVQTTEVNQPQMSTIGAASAITGDTTDLLEWSGAAADFKFLHDGSPVTITLLCRGKDLIGEAPYYLATGNKVANFGVAIYSVTGTEKLVFRAFNGTGYYYTFVNTNLAIDENAVMEIRYPISNRYYIRKNGTPVTDADLGTPSANDPTKQLAFGYTTSYGLRTSRLAQVCLYARAISDEESTTLATWLKAKVPI